MRLPLSIYLLLLIALAGCDKTRTGGEEQPWYLHYPEAFPVPEYPPDNLPDANRILLGKALFYDPLLSADSSISCASCHAAEFAFGQNTATSPGVFNRPGQRNVLPLFNLAWQPVFLREGTLPSLEMQVLVPIQEHHEFDFNIVLVAERMKQIQFYDTLAEKAYSRKPDAFVITRALAAFERTIISASSRYDRVQSGQERFTDEEQLGMTLFFSDRLQCGNCHPAPFFTNFQVLNNGLYSNYSDPGRYRATRQPADSGKFKVPSLRNLGMTAPYMHDGSLRHLNEVIDHYARGGTHSPYQDSRIRSFYLSPEEKNALLAFLESLNDFSIQVNPRYSRP